MRLTVVLLNWRDPQPTLRCAAAIAGWRALSPALAVVDNGSTEASHAALAAAVPPASVIPSLVNLGFAGGNNLGIRRALDEGAEAILLLNTDAEITESAVAALFGRLEADPTIAVIGPAILEQGAAGERRLIGGRDIAVHADTRIVAPAGDLARLPGYPVRDADYVPGTALLARASAFRDVGLLDETYFFSGEIADFCRRVRNSGRRVCVDLSVTARHDTAQTASRLRQTLYVYYSLRNRFLYVRKHHARDRRRLIARWVRQGLTESLRALRARNLGTARANLLALIDGLAGRYGDGNAHFL